jgi:hypothetical protein
MRTTGKKKPDVFTPGWEALLLSHIKAPAQGGKAGSGKPPASEFNKDETRFQATRPLSLTFLYKKREPSNYQFIVSSDNHAARNVLRFDASGTIFSL